MSTLTYCDRHLALQPHESVLDCLLRNGEALPYACKAGMCQACLVRAVDCEATEESRKWIKPALQAKGYTLACQWVPATSVAAEPPQLADFAIESVITTLTALNNHVLRVRLQLADRSRLFACRPGQYVSATNPLGCVRAYSTANDLAEEGELELHIGRTSHGEWSGWLFTAARPGDRIYLSGPHGTCHYDPREDAGQPLLLAGTGTGLAPLYGIVRDALRQGHTAPIRLYHGGRRVDTLYLAEELRVLAERHANFTYHPCVIDAVSNRADLRQGRLEQILREDQTALDLRNARIFLCGTPDLVHLLRKRLYLQGARAENIHCDPFTERVVTA